MQFRHRRCRPVDRPHTIHTAKRSKWPRAPTGDETTPEGVTVRGSGYRPLMDVIAHAAAQGFELEERILGDAWVWGWSREGDERWPCFQERRLALSWMDDRLRRSGVFQ